ncbi:MAG TPA: hypothetical protein VI589_01535 [Vicinamibacteria bacterium]
MPAKQLALEKGGPPRLEIEWQGNFKDFEVRLDGALLGSFADRKALSVGRVFSLEDGSRLEVKLGRIGILPELSLTHNGVPLPGSDADPEQRVNAAASMIFFIAALNALLGIVAGVFDIQFLKALGLGLGSLIVGAIYGALGYLVKEKRSSVALGFAVGLFVIDGLSLLVFMEPGRTPPIGGLVARILFLVPMVMGFPALRALAAEETRPRPVQRRSPHRAPSPGSASPTGPPSAASAPPPRAASAPSVARTFTGDAERRRLELSQAPSVATTRMAPSGHRIETRTRTDADAASSGLRFVARRCEITPSGLAVSSADGSTRTVPYAAVLAVVVRLLPPDPPWSSQPLFDGVVRSADNTAWQAVRVFSTTPVNYGALPGGASTSRLENMRRLGAHLLAQNPQLSLDPETAAFVTGGKPPVRFVSTTHFAEYDQRYS